MKKKTPTLTLLLTLTVITASLYGCKGGDESDTKTSLILEKGIAQEEQQEISELEKAIEPTSETEVQTQPESEKTLTAEDVRTEAQEAIQAAEQFAKQRELELHQTIDTQYEEFIAKINSLKEEADIMREKAKARVTSELAKINNGITQSAAELAKAESSSEETLKGLNEELKMMLATLDGKGSTEEEAPPIN